MPSRTPAHVATDTVKRVCGQRWRNSGKTLGNR
jgi:hypothetical protein